MILDIYVNADQVHFQYRTLTGINSLRIIYIFRAEYNSSIISIKCDNALWMIQNVRSLYADNHLMVSFSMKSRNIDFFFGIMYKYNDMIIRK